MNSAASGTEKAQDRMREEFEAAYKETFGRTPERNSDYHLYIDERAAWWAWQASRAALVVELPQPIERECPDDAFDDSWMDGYNGERRMREWCCTAIESAGVKVKA